MERFLCRLQPKLVLMLLLLTLLFCACGSGGKATCISSVEVSTSEGRAPVLTICAELHSDYLSAHSGETIYLFAVPSPGSLSLADRHPAGQARAAASMTFRLTDVTDSSLYAGYVLAAKGENDAYRALTEPVYLSNPEELGRENDAARQTYPEAFSIKGMWDDGSGDAFAIGAAQTVVRVELSDCLAFEGSRDAMHYTFDGVTYYLNREAILNLDHSVKRSGDAGMRVYLSVTLSAPPSDLMSPSQRALYAAGAQPSAGQHNAEQYALSMADEESFARVAGFLRFLAERYTRADGRYGFAGSIILGECVNQSRLHYYAGAQSLSSFVADYAALLRAADTAMRSCFAEGRVYASLGCNFTALSPSPSDAADPMLDYAACDFLDALAAQLERGGDIPWNLALTLMPVGAADAWAGNAEGYLAAGNFDVLTDYLAADAMLFGGQPRRVAITDFRISGAGEEDAGTAASYPYAYAKALENGRIEALICRMAEGAVLTQGSPLWENLKQIDLFGGTLRETDLIGSEWGELYPLVTAAACRILMSGSAVNPDSKTEACRAEPLFDFSGGSIQGFFPAEYVDYLEFRPDTPPNADRRVAVLYAPMYRTEADAAMRIGCADVDAGCFKGAHYLAVVCRTDSPGERAGLTLRLGQNGGESLVYESSTTVGTNAWSTIYFDIGDYAARLEEGTLTLHLSVEGNTNDPPAGDYGLALAQIDLLYADTGSWLVWIVVTLAILLAAAVVIIILLHRARPRRRYR